MDEMITLCYLLRYLGFPVKGPTSLCADNQGMIKYSTNMDYGLKKNHVAIL